MEKIDDALEMPFSQIHDTFRHVERTAATSSTVLAHLAYGAIVGAFAAAA